MHGPADAGKKDSCPTSSDVRGARWPGRWPSAFPAGWPSSRKSEKIPQLSYRRPRERDQSIGPPAKPNDGIRWGEASMPIWTLAKKDLRLLVRDPRALMILLAMPFLFILVLGISLGEGFGKKPLEGLRVS